jgi:hypothetical protein
MAFFQPFLRLCLVVRCPVNADYASHAVLWTVLAVGIGHLNVLRLEWDVAIRCAVP